MAMTIGTAAEIGQSDKVKNLVRELKCDEDATHWQEQRLKKSAKVKVALERPE